MHTLYTQGYLVYVYTDAEDNDLARPMECFGLSRWLGSKEFSCQKAGLIPGSGRSPGEGNGNSLQYSCLGNLMDRGAWKATDHGVGVAKSQT